MVNRRASRGELPAAIDIGVGSKVKRRWCRDTFLLWYCATRGQPYLLSTKDIAERSGKRAETFGAAQRRRRAPRPLHIGERGSQWGRDAYVRWPVLEVESWTGDDWKGESWGPLRFGSHAAVVVLGKTGVAGRPRLSAPSEALRKLEVAGVIGERVTPDGLKAGKGRDKKFCLRADLEARFRQGVRLGRHLPSEWAEPLLLDDVDLAGYFGVNRDHIRYLRRTGMIPDYRPLMPGLIWNKDSARVWRKVWRRDEIERWLAQTERHAANAQADWSSGGFITPEQLAATFQVNTEQLSGLGIACDKRGYRPDIVVNWLAHQREEQRQRDAVLAAVATVSPRTASSLLGIDCTTLICLSTGPDPVVVGFDLPPTRTTGPVASSRGPMRYRLRSLQAFAGFTLPDIDGQETLREAELADALSIHCSTLHGMYAPAEARRRASERDFFACAAKGRCEPFKATPDDPMWSVEILTAEAFLNGSGRPTVEQGGTTRTAARRHRDQRLKEEWSKVLELEPRLPRARGRKDIRRYSLAEAAAWLDRLEEATPGGPGHCSLPAPAGARRRSRECRPRGGAGRHGG
jgi:hypothetical protein